MRSGQRPGQFRIIDVRHQPTPGPTFLNQAIVRALQWDSSSPGGSPLVPLPMAGMRESARLPMSAWSHQLLYPVRLSVHGRLAVVGFPFPG